MKNFSCTLSIELILFIYNTPGRLFQSFKLPIEQREKIHRKGSLTLEQYECLSISKGFRWISDGKNDSNNIISLYIYCYSCGQTINTSTES